MRPAACALLTALVLAAFWPTLSNDFLNYDDPLYVTANRHVREGLSVEGLVWAATTFHATNWHPLTWVSHMLDWELYGSSPAGHHLTSLLLHLANTILLFLLLARLTGGPGRSFFAAALFGVHPLHVESVAWIAERKDVLSTLLWLLTTWAYAGYCRTGSRLRYAATLALFALGLSAKPMLVTLPLTLLLLDFWPLGRLGSGRGSAGIRRLAAEKLPLLAVAAGSAVVTLAAQRAGGALKTLTEYPWLARAANAAQSYVAYLAKTVRPAGLSVFYPFPADGAIGPKAIASAAVLALATALAVRSRRERPYLIVGWLWYLVTLVPVIGLVQVGEQAMADRYTYVPLIGIFAILAWAVPDSLGGLAAWAGAPFLSPASSRAMRAALAVAAGLMLSALALAARGQARLWRDPVALFEHAIAVTRDNEAAHVNLGDALVGRGQYDRALLHFEAAIRIDPRSEEAYNDIGIVRNRQGKPDEAIESYRRALAIKPDYAGAWYNMGVALAAAGRPDDAMAAYRRAVELDPDDANAHNNMGALWNRAGRAEEALAELDRAIEIEPDFATAHHNRAVALYLSGRYAEAWRALARAREAGLAPDPKFVALLSERMPPPR